jgi:16S rRNA G966 N2-methylase RsmD
LYAAVNKVFKAAGGKWKSAQKVHVFPSDPREFFATALDTGEVVREQVLWQSYYTPEWAALDLCVFAAFEVGAHILEPSAGEGALALAALKKGAGRVTCIEKNPKAVLKLQALAATSKGGIDPLIVEADFLSVHPFEIYDSVVMNPPYTNGQDKRHVMHAMKFVKPGGAVAAILPHGGNSERTQLDREFIAFTVEYNGKLCMALPSGTFTDTAIETKIMLYKKPR